MGDKPIPAPKSKIDLIEHKLARIEFEGGNPLKPMFHISDTMFKGLCALWQIALVLKLLGKSIGCTLMKERLRRL